VLTTYLSEITLLQIPNLYLCLPEQHGYPLFHRLNVFSPILAQICKKNFEKFLISVRQNSTVLLLRNPFLSDADCVSVHA
jgi:hypothetical protein